MWPRAAESGAALLFALSSVIGQEPAAVTAHVAFAAAPARARLPAIAWFCEHWLPHQAFWPAGLDPTQGFLLSWRNGRLRAAAADGLPPGLVCHGAVAVADGPPLAFACGTDGTEDWVGPMSWPVPTPWRLALDRLGALSLDAPRTLDVGIVVGHLAGGMLPGDPLAALLQLAAMRCGDVTWTAWIADGERLRVRGRSDGGLWLPALLLVLASDRGASWNGLAVRAYGSHDGARGAAVHELSARDPDGAATVLRAMLHADDAARAAAIDALVRRSAIDDLPAIAAAAAADLPLTTLTAADAIAALWPAATPAVRERTRAAIAASPCPALRALDLREPGPVSPTPDAAPLPVRAACWLALTAAGLLGLWWRERARALPGPLPA
jgi:hypothetical protein